MYRRGLEDEAFDLLFELCDIVAFYESPLIQCSDCLEKPCPACEFGICEHVIMTERRNGNIFESVMDFEKNVGKGTQRRQVTNFDDADRVSRLENVADRNFKPPRRVEGVSNDVKTCTTPT